MDGTKMLNTIAIDLIKHAPNTRSKPDTNENTSATTTDETKFKPSDEGTEYIINSIVQLIKKG